MKLFAKLFSYLTTLLLISLIYGCSNGSNDKMTDETTVVAEEEYIGVQSEPDTILHEIASLEEGLALFEELNYTAESWRAGVREIPRFNVLKISDRWRNKTSKEIEVQLKKQIFFRVLAPLALESNEKILVDRDRIMNLARNPQGKWKSSDRQYIVEMAKKYKLPPPAPQNIKMEFLDELLNRVDIIPPSLALTQSAEESGWGTSRFATEGNALFGQWSWDENAMRPEQQRGGMGNYGIAKFDTPLGSMMAYMHNLNTHKAYEPLRARRTEMRKAGLEPTGYELASTLTKYSERGEEYVEELHSIMRVNHLEQVDSAYLSSGPVIIVMPVE